MTGGIMLHFLIIRERVLALLRDTWDVVEPVIVIDPALAAARSLANLSEVSA
jgi:hypothetical protein